MTREEIIAMARESCDPDKVDAWHNGFWTITQEELECFAALVAATAIKDAPDYKMGYADGVAAEREACARVCEDEWSTLDEVLAGAQFAAYIRERKNNT